MAANLASSEQNSFRCLEFKGIKLDETLVFAIETGGSPHIFPPDSPVWFLTKSQVEERIAQGTSSPQSGAALPCAAHGHGTFPADVHGAVENERSLQMVVQIVQICSDGE